MLVLTRKVNQQIRLGDDITVTILRVQGNSIRIGVEAPREVRVVRGELNALDQKTEHQNGTPVQNGSEPGAAIPTASEKTASSPAACGPTEIVPEMFEFDLEDIDAETLQSLEQAAEQSQERAQVYHLRTSAPLARFFPRQARETANSYIVS